VTQPARLDPALIELVKALARADAAIDIARLRKARESGHARIGQAQGG